VIEKHRKDPSLMSAVSNSIEMLRLDDNNSNCATIRDFIGINVSCQVIGQTIEIEHGNPITLYELKMTKIIK